MNNIAIFYKEPIPKPRPRTRRSPIIVKKEKEIRDGFKRIKENKQQCKDLISYCQMIKDDEAYDQCDKYECDVYLEHCKHNQFF